MKTKDTLSLLECGCTPSGKPEVDEAIAALESSIGVTLPQVFKEFLKENGSCDLDGWVACDYPTPFGLHNIQKVMPIEEIKEYVGSKIVPWNMICFGRADFGSLTCLSVCGLDRGHVYSFDGEMIYFEDPNNPLGLKYEEHEEFMRLKESNQLPERPWGYENCYHIADTFTDFLQRLQSYEKIKAME